MINPLAGSTTPNSGLNQEAKINGGKNNPAPETGARPASRDTVEIGSKRPQEQMVYTKADLKKTGSADINQLKMQVAKATDNLRSLVEKLIVKQGGQATSLDILGKDDETYEDLYADTVAKAREAISEDGEFGVKAVSDRIVNFAISLLGGDTSRLDEIKGYINKGFEEAAKVFGGNLPDICCQTQEEIMNKLDKWALEA